MYQNAGPLPMYDNSVVNVSSEYHSPGRGASEGRGEMDTRSATSITNSAGLGGSPGHSARRGSTVVSVRQTNVPSPQYLDEGIPQVTGAEEDMVHEILAMNTVAMERCSEGQLEETSRILTEAFMKLNANSAFNLGGGFSSGASDGMGGGKEGSIDGAGGSTGYGGEEGGMFSGAGGSNSGPIITNPKLLDQLKATTLNNLGVVESHRGQHRKALSHFESSRKLEETWGISSPSISLNTCAAYNALQMYDKATAAALETIDMLRTLEIQRQKDRKALIEATGKKDESYSRLAKSSVFKNKNQDLSAAAANAELNQLSVADSHNRSLWGAAWHNLGVAQVNTVNRSKDLSEHTNCLAIFRNAMSATQDLLGLRHPMTLAVIETFRSIRGVLRSHGAFKQHPARMTAQLPAIDPREQEYEDLSVEVDKNGTRHGTLERIRKELAITFRGEATGGMKVVEHMSSLPYPGAPPAPYNKRNYSNSQGKTGLTGNGRLEKSKRNKKRMPAALGTMPLSDALLRACAIYGNPHPLLYCPPAASYSNQKDSQGAAYLSQQNEKYSNTAPTSSGRSRDSTNALNSPAPHGSVPAGDVSPNQDWTNTRDKSANTKRKSKRSILPSSSSPSLPAISVERQSNIISKGRSPSHRHRASNKGTTPSKGLAHTYSSQPSNQTTLNPPPNSTVKSGATAEHFTASKFILLAGPAQIQGMESTQKASALSSDVRENISAIASKAPSLLLHEAVMPAEKTNASENNETGADAETNPNSTTDGGQREFFEAMWFVTADPTLINARAGSAHGEDSARAFQNYHRDLDGKLTAFLAISSSDSDSHKSSSHSDTELNKKPEKVETNEQENHQQARSEEKVEKEPSEKDYASDSFEEPEEGKADGLDDGTQRPKPLDDADNHPENVTASSAIQT